MRSALLAATALSAFVAPLASALAAPITFGYTGSFQTFLAPSAGVYDILAFGAQGGDGGFYGGGSGGLGAEIGGDFVLAAGEVLQIAVGGRGTTGGAFGANGGGGGGGSFVVAPGGNPLVIAGGGGGGRYLDGGRPGLAATDGGSGGPDAPGGTGGKGGGVGASGGGGGGGFAGNGGDGGATGGSGYPSLAGGSGADNGGAGGFGGGGGGDLGGGGGGGYSGGGSGVYGGGGGGSFNGSLLTNADSIQLPGVQRGDGLVMIDLVATTPPVTEVPEPASLVLFASGLVGVVTFRRWRAR